MVLAMEIRASVVITRTELYLLIRSSAANLVLVMTTRFVEPLSGRIFMVRKKFLAHKKFLIHRKFLDHKKFLVHKTIITLTIITLTIITLTLSVTLSR